jgi:hypothetical protein
MIGLLSFVLAVPALPFKTSPVQVLGAGALSDMQTEALIYEKKKQVR